MTGRSRATAAPHGGAVSRPRRTRSVSTALGGHLAEIALPFERAFQPDQVHLVVLRLEHHTELLDLGRAFRADALVGLRGDDATFDRGNGRALADLELAQEALLGAAHSRVCGIGVRPLAPHEATEAF